MLVLQTTFNIFSKDVCIVNVDGSENYKHVYIYLKDQNIAQYFARPHNLKDEPHVENLIGKLQQECLDENRQLSNLNERKQQVANWLNSYHFFRPHQALNYQTPQEFCDIPGITIRRAEVHAT